MQEIISFARPMATAQKAHLKREEKKQKTPKKSLPDFPLPQSHIGDSVHFGGTDKKRKRAEETPPPESSATASAESSSTESDDEMAPPPPKRPRGGHPAMDFFELLAGGDPSKPPIRPGAEMAKHIKPFDAEDSEWEAYKTVGAPYADKLEEITSRSYLNNAVLRADDGHVQKSILMSLKEKLGLTSSLYSVDCSPKNLEKLEEHYDGAPVLSKVFSESSKSLGLPTDKPAVLFLKNANSEEAESLQKREAFQRIKNKNPHFRFVIGQPTKSEEPAAENAFQIMLGGKPKSTDTKPAPFETVNVKPLNATQWSKVLQHDKQAKQILDHWKLSIPKETLQTFLEVVQRGKSGPLEREHILGELDSLASYIRVRLKDQSEEVAPFHVIEYEKTLKLPSQALVKSTGGMSSNPMEQKPFKIIKAKDIKTRLEHVVGQQKAKDVLNEVLGAVKYPALYKHLNEGDDDAQNNYVLLMGEPGGGKTMLAQAVAGEGKGAFISTSGSQFVNVYVGMGANNMRQLKAAIEQSPEDFVVVFLDEIDSLGNRQKSGGETGGSSEDVKTINEFLALSEGIEPTKKKVLLIGATNRPEALDEAILSRFHHKIGMEKLDEVGRRSLLDKQVNQKKLTLDSSVDKDELVRKTEGFSGRDLRNVLKLAKQSVIRNIPVAEKERLEKSAKARKQFQLNVSQQILLDAISEIKKGWDGANNVVDDSPRPFGMYI